MDSNHNAASSATDGGGDNKKKGKQQQQRQQALWLAARAGNTPRCLALIVDAAASGGGVSLVQAQDPARFRYDALMCALRACRVDTAAALLDARANLHATNAFGGTALHYIADLSDRKLCRAALDRGARVNATDDRDETPLMRAACHGRAHMCTFLLDYGKADVALRNVERRTAHELAREHGHTHAARAIRAWQTSSAAAFAFACGTRHARYDTAHTHTAADHWTNSKLFDVHLIDEITAFVSSNPTPLVLDNSADWRCSVQ
jgi:hypothetical protein